MGDMFGNMSSDSEGDEGLRPKGVANSSEEEKENDGTEFAPPVPDLVESESSHEVGYEPRHGPPILVKQIRERGLSFQLWPAATGLCWYLDNVYNGCDLQGARVVELGAGTGMVGVMAARLGAHVTLTDLPHVLPNLQSNLELNSDNVEACGGSLEVRPLRWGVQEDIAPLGAPFGLILASDCVYYDTLFEPLMQTLKWLCGIGVSGKAVHDGDHSNGGTEDGNVCVQEGKVDGPIVVLAHLRRWKKDGHFFRIAGKFFNVEVVHKHPPPENARIGVVVYKFRRKTSPR